MHIPDGFIRTDINIINYVVSASTLVYVSKKARSWPSEKVPLIGVTAAFIFAAQMLNFPILGGTSGHFLGAFFAAMMLGPLAAFLVMALILTVQCLVFADGGLVALGTNIVNMGVIGAIVSYYFFKVINVFFPKNQKGFLISVAISSWMSVVIASSACAFELAVSAASPFHIVFPAMVSVHSLIGIGEAIITVTAVGFILKIHPEMVSAWQDRNI